MSEVADPSTAAPANQRRQWAREAGWVAAVVALSEALAFANLATVGWNATRDTSWLAPWTFGLRPHHLHVGLVLLLGAWIARRRLTARTWLVRVGIGLIIADTLHHFLVLWPMTGEHGFDLMYPPTPG
jgi:hypothetical protein